MLNLMDIFRVAGIVHSGLSSGLWGLACPFYCSPSTIPVILLCEVPLDRMAFYEEEPTEALPGTPVLRISKADQAKRAPEPTTTVPPAKPSASLLRRLPSSSKLWLPPSLPSLHGWKRWPIARIQWRTGCQPERRGLSQTP